MRDKQSVWRGRIFGFWIRRSNGRSSQVLLRLHWLRRNLLNGRRSAEPQEIPLSIVITLFTVSFCYCVTSIVLTMMILYYIINPDIPISQAFEYVGMGWARYFVLIGAIASLATCLYASMFSMPRIVYSLASDGLIFRSLSYVMPKLKTPVAAALSSGLFAGSYLSSLFLHYISNFRTFCTLQSFGLQSIRTKPKSNQLTLTETRKSGDIQPDNVYL